MMKGVVKAKKKHFHNKKSNKLFRIDVNLKGFLCSCNSREKQCVREAYNILNKYADTLWPSTTDDAQAAGNEIEDELQKELQELKGKDAKRFQVIDSGAPNFLFIQTTVDDPLRLAETILSDLFETKSQQTRFLLRLIPVETTCKAYVDDIVKSFEGLCEKHFSKTAKSFNVVFNHRNNNSVSRDEVINSVAAMVTKKGQDNDLEHKVDLKNGEVSIVVEVIKGFAFLSVVPNFNKYKKYNLLAFCPPESADQDHSEEKTLEGDKTDEINN